MRALQAYHQPTSLAAALELATSLPDARFVAGGTDLLVQVKKGKLREPGALVSLRSVPELAGIRSGPPLDIGSTATLHELCVEPTVREHYPVLVAAARVLGSRQIQNVATIAGNLCNASPAADMAPPLLVLDARVRLLGRQGERELALADFLVGPGESALEPAEILTSILVDPPAAGQVAAFERIGRVKMDLAIVNAAVCLELDGRRCTRARVAVGAVAPTPLRLPSVERCLEGSELDDAVLREAERLTREAVAPISDLRGSADYRRRVAGVLVKRAATACAERVS